MQRRALQNIISISFPPFHWLFDIPVTGSFTSVLVASLWLKKKSAFVDEWHFKWKSTVSMVYHEMSLFELDSFNRFHHIDQSYTKMIIITGNS